MRHAFWAYLALYFFPLILPGQNQWISSESIGVVGGIRCWVGYPANQIGLTIQGYYRRQWIQANAGISLQYNVSHLGPRPRQAGWEAQLYTGLLAGFGPSGQSPSSFLHPVSNQTGSQYAIGYAWLWYLDQMSTSQVTGMLGLHLGDWEILSENDAYTGRLDDRFRTGTIALTYRTQQLRVGLSNILWTGDPRSPGVRRVSKGVGRFGYKDLSEATYGRFSHGILALQASWVLPYRQVAEARIGVDAEQIRHLIQNRVIHDMRFLPAQWVPVRNRAYPMLDEHGMPYLDPDRQHIRPPRLYFQAGLNPAPFY